ncbi:glycosyltransferase family 4 protein [Patescibacteria group bacterium]|nr:glycosyltransferase family 4 protein [Patescibacteria group bacterium]
MKKIAVDSGPLVSGHKVRGIGVHTRELLLALDEKTKIPRKATKSQRGKLKGLKIEAVDFGKADLSKYDLLHFQYFHPFFLTIPPKVPTKYIVTIHDLIPLIYPKHYPPGIKGKIRFMVQKARIKKAEAIITISKTSKKDIVRFLGVPQEKIYVTYLAPRKIFRKLEIGNWKLEIKRRYGLPGRFVLYVGDVNHNKNVLGLVNACKKAKIHLVICGKQAKDIRGAAFNLESLEGPQDWARYLFGKPHPEQAHYEKLLEEFENTKTIIRLGYVPDEDLVQIYNLATVYCQPSFYEGFGLSVLEAFACGTPVVAAKTQALVEIVEGAPRRRGFAGQAALFADPNNPKEIAEKISELIKNKSLRIKMVNEGQETVKKFTWKKTAESTLEVYKEILK